MNPKQRAKTVRFSLAGAALAMLLGLWGAIYGHDAAKVASTAGGEPVAATSADAVGVAPAAGPTQPSSQVQAATQSQPATQPAAQVHTRTRAS